VEILLSSICNYFWTDIFVNFFKTGTFFFLQYSNHPEVIGTLDWVGVNYYTHLTFGVNYRGVSLAPRPGDVMTDMDYAIYAEGLYYSIEKMSALGRPIYITENGIADEKDDRRKIWIDKHLYATYKAIKDGFDVRGFYYWSLMDNFEWAEGYRMKFGLYHTDLVTQKRTLREGSKAFIQRVKESKKNS